MLTSIITIFIYNVFQLIEFKTRLGKSCSVCINKGVACIVVDDLMEKNPFEVTNMNDRNNM